LKKIILILLCFAKTKGLYENVLSIQTLLGGEIMGWKKIAESNDLIVFEQKLNKERLKIEARRKDNGWEVFKTKIVGENSNLISEHMLDNKKQAIDMINKLKKDTSTQVIKRQVKVSLKRVYKEEFMEKWELIVNEEAIKNFVYLKYDNKVKADVVLHEKFYLVEKSILNQLGQKLGLKELAEAIQYEVFYYKRFSSNTERREPVDMNFIDIEFDFSDEEYY